MSGIIICSINLAPFVSDVLPSLNVFLYVYFGEKLGLYLQLILLMSGSQEKGRCATVSTPENRSRMALKHVSNSVYALNNFYQMNFVFILYDEISNRIIFSLLYAQNTTCIQCRHMYVC